MSYHNYTDEEIKFLIDNSSFYSRKQLTEIFNEKYSTNISVKSITNKCNSFSAYGKEERHYVGDEVIRSDGYVMVKVSNNKSIPKHKRWELKHRLVWEKENGQIPNGYVVFFKDGNKQNCDIDNLVLASKRVAPIMSRNKFFSENSEETNACISLSKLILKLSDLEKEVQR